MSTVEGHGDGAREPGAVVAVESWRDVCAAYLVYAGLRLATPDARNRMVHALADEWRAAVGRALARSESMARHPAGKGGRGPARSDGARVPVHLADRMDAAYRARRRDRRGL